MVGPLYLVALIPGISGFVCRVPLDVGRRRASLSTSAVSVSGEASSVSSSAGASFVAEPSDAYDPEAAEAVFWVRPRAWLVRNAELFAPLFAFCCRVLVDRARRREEAKRSARARELLDILGSLGPAIIKAGQALASRPDLLPAVL